MMDGRHTDTRIATRLAQARREFDAIAAALVDERPALALALTARAIEQLALLLESLLSDAVRVQRRRS